MKLPRPIQACSHPTFLLALGHARPGRVCWGQGRLPFCSDRGLEDCGLNKAGSAMSQSPGLTWHCNLVQATRERVPRYLVDPCPSLGLPFPSC